jgi:hypothetical protein
MAEYRTTLQILFEVPHIEFQQYLWTALWDSWKSPLTALCKLDFIMYKNLNYPNPFVEVFHAQFQQYLWNGV